MKICAYVLTKFAKQNYKNENYNIRLNAGMQVVIDILRRRGYTVDFAGDANVHKYDVVLWQCTSDCDWWEFIAERATWAPGDYKVIVGGAGVLNVRAVLTAADYFVLGRAEGVIEPLIDALAECGEYDGDEHVINARTFDPDRLYYINQVDEPYCHEITLENGKAYKETQIGCNHKCLFCGYTWQRKWLDNKIFGWDWMGSQHKDMERAILDLYKDEDKYDWQHLRTTAIDGFSERIRRAVKKPITREMVRQVLSKLATVKPHEVKFYNVIGFPTETADDWREFAEDLKIVDAAQPHRDKQMAIVIHSTPFRPMPATPLACEPMQYRNFRGEIFQTLRDREYKGRVWYQGNAFFAVESMGTESLPTVIASAIIHRGTEADIDLVVKLARSRKYQSASVAVKIATLEKYIDPAKYFRRYEPEELPSRYLRTYLDVTRFWSKHNFE